MSKSHEGRRGLNRRQLLGGGLAATAAGVVAAVFPELGASAATRLSRVNTKTEEWYLEAPVSQIEVSKSLVRTSASSLASKAAGTGFAPHTADLENSKSVVNTLRDGRTITATGVPLGSSHVILHWEEAQANGLAGRSLATLYETNDDEATLVAVGATADTLTTFAATPALTCAVGTHLVRLCTSISLSSLSTCCGGCVAAAFGNAAVAIACAAVVCAPCLATKCKKWRNTCVINS